MYDYLMMYGNLNLYMLTDDELFTFSLKCVKGVNMSIHLIEYVQGSDLGRDFDLSNFELSELMRVTSKLLDGVDAVGRYEYINIIDSLLFMVSSFEGTSKSVKGYLKAMFSKEMRQWVRITTQRQLARG